MKRSDMLLPAFFCLIILMCCAGSALAYNNKKTHPTMTDKAVRSGSAIEKYFYDNLAIEGIVEKTYPYTTDKGATKFNKVIELLRDGSDWEDVPICRASNHFHNPLGA